MSYTAFHFKVEPPQPGSDILIAMLGEMGFESFDLTDSGFTAYIDSEQGAGIDPGQLVFEDFIFSWSREKAPDQNWNAEWENNFAPVEIPGLVRIRAPFHAPAEGFMHEVVIMPKMSFGTGHHQTTRLMCAAICRTEMKGRRVLDMGCGTGVLAILAAMRGAADVTGVDIDDWSAENARENCASNGFAGIGILKGDADILQEMAPFDIIFANINKNILRKHMKAYAAALSPGSRLFLSGFFVTDREELSACCASEGLTVTGMESEDEWAMLEAHR